MKLATRRVRLLALYTPDVLKKLQEGEIKDREEVEVLLHPRPSRPASRAEPRPTRKTTPLKSTGTTPSMACGMDVLWDALVDARQNYYREVSFRDLALGGLNGLQAVATTKGLEQAFPEARR